MEFVATTADPAKKVSDCIIVGVYDRKVLGDSAEVVDKAAGGLISGLLELGDISTKLGSATLLSRVDGVKGKRAFGASLRDP